jgi:hypothetical protein
MTVTTSQLRGAWCNNCERWGDHWTDECPRWAGTRDQVRVHCLECGWRGIRAVTLCECYEYTCSPQYPGAGCPRGSAIYTRCPRRCPPGEIYPGRPRRTSIVVDGPVRIRRPK